MESTNLQYLQDTVLPYCIMMEEEFNRKLFKPSEVGKYGVHFNFARAIQTNRKDEAEYFRTLLTNGIMSLNEIRGEMGLPKIDSEEGDTHWLQLSYASAKDIASGKYTKQNSQDQLQNQDPNQTKQNKQQ
jgi:phage portal protein BeeE